MSAVKALTQLAHCDLAARPYAVLHVNDGLVCHWKATPDFSIAMQQAGTICLHHAAFE